MEMVYFIDDKMGGIASLNDNLINNNPSASVKQRVILISKEESAFTRNAIRFKADEVTEFKYSENENAYSYVKRLGRLLTQEEGVLVLNDCVEMEMLDRFPVKQTTYQLVHDEYNLSLALQYPQVVDVFIAHSRLFYDKLVAAMPHRTSAIFYLPHGVPVPVHYRNASTDMGPVKLLFLGRMNRAKGIFDLPVIAGLLRQWDIPYQFTCIGNGPELPALKDAWKDDPHVVFLSPATNEEVINICAAQDIYVLPTRFEGSPVALLETMSAGLVPVITDLPGGIREIVTEDIGFRITEGDNRAFAEKIKLLSQNRSLLNELGSNARNKIIAQFNVQQTAAAYHDLFGRYASFFTPKKLQYSKIGSRLDQPFIPAFITRLIRTSLRIKA